jgi:hypothetical protein
MNIFVSLASGGTEVTYGTKILGSVAARPDTQRAQDPGNSDAANLLLTHH